MASGQRTPQNTPRKIYETVNVTPTSKEIVCISCGKEIKKASYRRYLRSFKDSGKSEACLKIERVLNAPLPLHTDIVCKNCLASVTCGLNKIDDLRKKILATLQILEERYSSTVIKRGQISTLANSDKGQKKVRTQLSFDQVSVDSVGSESPLESLLCTPPQSESDVYVHSDVVDENILYMVS